VLGLVLEAIGRERALELEDVAKLAKRDLRVVLKHHHQHAPRLLGLHKVCVAGRSGRVIQLPARKNENIRMSRGDNEAITSTTSIGTTSRGTGTVGDAALGESGDLGPDGGCICQYS